MSVDSVKQYPRQDDIGHDSQNDHELYEALFEYNPCQTIVVDTQGRIITYNRAKRQSDDRLPTAGDVIFKDYAGKYDIDMYSELMKCISTSQTKDFPEQQYVDKILSTTISPFPGGAIIITKDVTEQKKAEHALRKSEEFNRALFEYNPCQTIIVDTQGRIITYNRAKCESGDRLPHPGDVIFRDYAGKYDIDMYSQLMECIETGQTRTFGEQQYVDKILSTTISPFPGGATVITEDVTKRKEAQRALQRANEILTEQDRAKIAFVASLSHEMRTSLCIFHNAVSNLNTGKLKLDNTIHKTYKMVTESVDRLARIIDDFVELSEIEVGNLKPAFDEFEMNSLICEVIDSMKRRLDEKKIKVKTSMPAKALAVNGEAAMLGKVIWHLLDNAIKYSPAEGKVVVKLEDLGGQVAVSVKDNGPGVEGENLEKIFDCFVRFDVPGSCTAGIGIGLSLADKIIKLHAGKIWVNSLPDKGSTFRFVIPKIM
jgi:signal transduction histidine kinase